MKLSITILLLIQLQTLAAQPRFRALVLYENGGHHLGFTNAALPWLDKLAADSSFTVDYIMKTDSITSSFLAKYQLFIQLDFPPYGWKAAAARAFEDYIKSGKGGWVGLHHATLLGEFDGFPMWQWFSEFMGGIQLKNYISGFARATVRIELPNHPCMKNLPAEFRIDREEWYTYDKSPRPDVKVLASVDESTYMPDSPVKMGDHPVVWTNENVKARNVYIFMGHGPDLFENSFYTTLLSNSIFWAAGKGK